MKTPMTQERLESALANQPRVSLAHLPTPLDECPRLAQTLSGNAKGPRIFIKRDDLTGQALGGNKVRHLEYRMGDALARGCDTFIYADPYNAARATAAACAKVGMRCVLLIHGHRNRPLQGNLLLAQLLGAELVFLDTDDPREARQQVPEVRQRLEKEGRKPYALQELPWYHLSAVVSYLNAALELEQQLGDLSITNAHIYIVTGHSQTGLQLAAKLLGLPWKLTGVAVGQHFEHEQPQAQWSRDASELLGFEQSLGPGEIETTFEYVGPGHGRPTQTSVGAIKLVASTEGIILDPAYTGKSMAALINDVQRGRFSNEDNIVFIHTGGIPILFEVAHELAKY